VSDYIPIKRAVLLDELDDKEVIQGYWDGKNNEPEPQGNRSKSYWHGWRNGMADGGHMEIDGAQSELAANVIKTKYFKDK